MTGEVHRRVPGSWLSRLTVGHLWLLAPWVGLVVAAFQPIRDNSFLWHVRAGTAQLEAGEVLRTDPFSYTFAGEPWRTQSWLIELLFGRLEGWFGLTFVPYWILVLSLVVFLAAGIRLREVGVDRRALALGLVLLFWMAVGFLVPRPVLVSFALLSVLLVAASGPRSRWVIPLIVWIWAASHGSFVLGIGYLVLEALRRRDRELALHAGVGVVAASLTAHGWHIWETLLDFANNRDALSYITEWGAPVVTDLPTMPFFLGIAGLLWNAIAGRIHRRDLWVIAPFLAFGLTSQRALFPAVIVLLPWMLPWRGDRTSTSLRTDNPVVVLVTGAIITVLPFLLVPEPGELDSDRFPVQAAVHLSGEPLFHDDYVGGYLIYERWPDTPVFVDDRAELYGGEFFGLVVHSRAGGPQWGEVERRWAVNEVLVRADDALVVVLEEAGWKHLHEDDGFVVLTR